MASYGCERALSWRVWIPVIMLLMLGRRTSCFQPWLPSFRQRCTLCAQRSISLDASGPQKVAIVGGGLAGLSTAYHLLELRSQRQLSAPFDLTIVDRAEVGTGGASAVAGGLVHPLSPRGKLVHWGMEGLEATNRLVHQADKGKGNAVLRSELFRIATSDKQTRQLQKTAELLPDLCDWMEPKVLTDRLNSKNIHEFGGLRLHNGCKVLHLPSYLKGLWTACQEWADSTVSVQWKQPQGDVDLDDYDAVVWAAGSGLFEAGGPFESTTPLPIQLVRGQSVEVRLASSASSKPTEALLSGKYISPLPEPDRVLVGATHEFQPEPMLEVQVQELLQEKTERFGPHVWEEGAVMERYTSGTRVQSQRGNRGRLPIVGRVDDGKNHWIFTGLSSRGLLYHGVYGKVLAHAILEDSEDCLQADCLDYDWWRRS